MCRFTFSVAFRHGSDMALWMVISVGQPATWIEDEISQHLNSQLMGELQ